MTTPCRFCQAPVEFTLPDDERMKRFVRVMVSRACCNRCADYQRGQRDRAERLGKLGLNFKYAADDEKGAILELAKRLMEKIVASAEDHHLIQGLSKDTPEWIETFRAAPDAAEWQSRQFVKGAADIAKQTHSRKVEEAEPQYDY